MNNGNSLLGVVDSSVSVDVFREDGQWVHGQGTIVENKIETTAHVLAGAEQIIVNIDGNNVLGSLEGCATGADVGYVSVPMDLTGREAPLAQENAEAGDRVVVVCQEGTHVELRTGVLSGELDNIDSAVDRLVNHVYPDYGHSGASVVDEIGNQTGMIIGMNSDPDAHDEAAILDSHSLADARFELKHDLLQPEPNSDYIPSGQIPASEIEAGPPTGLESDIPFDPNAKWTPRYGLRVR